MLLTYASGLWEQFTTVCGDRAHICLVQDNGSWVYGKVVLTSAFPFK